MAVKESASQPSGPVRGDIEFKTLNGTANLDADFLKVLTQHSTSNTKKKAATGKSWSNYKFDALTSLNLEEDFCAKVCICIGIACLVLSFSPISSVSLYVS